MTLLLFYLFFASIGIIVGSFLSVVIYYHLPIMMQRNYRVLTYPIAAVLVAMLIVAFMVTTTQLVFYVPVFKELFDRFGAALHYFTLMIMIVMFNTVSEWMQKYWHIGIVVVYDYFKKRLPKCNHFLDRTLLKLPVVGIILNKSAIARFARTLSTLSTLSATGVPLVEALESAAGACGSIIYAEAVMKIREEVSMGQSLQTAMAQVGLFPQMVQHLIAIGEEAGSMDAILAKVADLYEAEVDNLMNNLHSSLMDSIIRVILGILFVFVILGILFGGFIVVMYLIGLVEIK
jgi:type IV pilus assembly protein PilC